MVCGLLKRRPATSPVNQDFVLSNKQFPPNFGPGLRCISPPFDLKIHADLPALTTLFLSLAAGRAQ
jgi:hypothetical protein